MARQLKLDPITINDLLEFLKSQSDFSFEVQTLRALVDLGFTCEHGGTYDDPVTKKPREFDIRATRVFGQRFVRLAVECKNLRESYPLLISCLPRRVDESFYEIVYSVDPDTNPIENVSGLYSIAMQPSSRSVRLTGSKSIYRPGDPVGKSCDQVGRISSGDIVSGDSGVYDKWSQALSSADDLTYLACSDGSERTHSIALSLVLPILVVPNSRLWQVEYDANGNRMGNPKQVDRCSYFVGRQYYHLSVSGGDEVTLSHIEIVTSSGLLRLVDDLCGDEDRINEVFPLEAISDVLSSE